MLNLFNRNKGNGKTKFPRTYANSDFGITADVVCQPSQWNKVGQVTVPAQQEITFGANDPTGGSSVAGRSGYIRLDSTGGQLHGKIRLALTNANETNTVVVLEEHTSKFSADQNDRAKAVLIPEYPMRAKEDSKLQILFYPEGASAVTIDYDDADTLVRLPVTVYQ